MKKDFRLLPSDGDPAPAPDSDGALMASFLARELSAAEIVALQQRMESDAEFRERMEPLLEGWIVARVASSGHAGSGHAAAGHIATLTRAEIDAGWHRQLAAPLQKETIGAAAHSELHGAGDNQRRKSAMRIAATVAAIVLPIAAMGQLVVFSASHTGAPGHRFTRGLVPPAWRAQEGLKQHADSNRLPADLSGDGPVQIAVASADVVAQQNVPVVNVSPPNATTTVKLGGVLGVREAPDGRVLVNDAAKHQMRLFDKSLATSTVVLDSAPGSATSYGQPLGRGSPVIPFRGDSLIFQDVSPGQMLILDAFGKPSRTLALVSLFDLLSIRANGSGVDANGRLVYKASPYGTILQVNGRREGKELPQVVVPYSASRLPPPPAREAGAGGAGGGRGRAGGSGDGAPRPPVNGILVNVTRPDSLPVHRTDFDARRVDTVGWVNQPFELGTVFPRRYGGGQFRIIYRGDSAVAVKQMINPLYPVDEFAVLSDGTQAFVRGIDYHVDWIHPDGSRSSSGKLPFDWKRLSDEDKKHLADSVRAHLDSVEAWATRRANGTPAPTDSIAAVDSMKIANNGTNYSCGSGNVSTRACPPEPHEWPYEIVPAAEIADYYPPFRLGALFADADGNLWILPRSTSQSKSGELVYDVVNPKRGFLQRVRLPVGRSIAGFGKGGVVYLQFGDIKSGFVLERVTVTGTTLAR